MERILKPASPDYFVRKLQFTADVGDRLLFQALAPASHA